MIDNILLILLIVLVSAKLMGSLFSRIGLDSTVGELLTGIILGASLLNLIDAKSIETFAIIGSVFILFIAGMKQQDIEEIHKDKPAIKIGITLLVATTVIMGLFFYYVPKYFGINFTIIQAAIMGLAFAIIDVGVPAKILISKGLMRHPVGRIAVRSSIINIVLGLFLFTIITLMITPNLLDVGVKIGGVVLFFAITVGLIFFLSKISKFVMKLHLDEAQFSLALILILALAYFTEVIGFSSILGAFIGGVIVAKLPFAETRSFTDKIKSISFGLFVPLFFVWFGLSINLADIWKHIVLALLIFVAYIAIRFTITYWYMKRYNLKMPGLVSSSMLSVDVESLLILMVATQIGIFATDLPLTLFAPSVFLSTVLIVILVAVFSKVENLKKNVKEEREVNQWLERIMGKSAKETKVKRTIKKKKIVKKKAKK